MEFIYRAQKQRIIDHNLIVTQEYYDSLDNHHDINIFRNWLRDNNYTGAGCESDDCNYQYMKKLVTPLERFQRLYNILHICLWKWNGAITQTETTAGIKMVSEMNDMLNGRTLIAANGSVSALEINRVCNSNGISSEVYWNTTKMNRDKYPNIIIDDKSLDFNYDLSGFTKMAYIDPYFNIQRMWDSILFLDSQCHHDNPVNIHFWIFSDQTHVCTSKLMNDFIPTLESWAIKCQIKGE